MDLIADNAALAVAATGGAAGAHDHEEAAITVPEVWRPTFLALLTRRSLTAVDIFCLVAVILGVAFNLELDKVPQLSWIARAVLFAKLVLVLVVVSVVLGVLLYLWNKLSRSADPPKPKDSPDELKRELVRSWLESLPTEEPQDLKKDEESDIIDPVGDGSPLEPADITSNISEVLAHHISVEEKRAQNSEPNQTTLPTLDSTASVINLVRIAESGCPGGDVAWLTNPIKESWSHEKHEVPAPVNPPHESRPPPSDDPCPLPVRADPEHFVRTDTDISLSQEGLNFDESPEDSAESSTPIEEADSSRERDNVVQVFSKGILSDFFDTLPPKEDSSDSLKVTDEEWQEEEVGATAFLKSSHCLEDCSSLEKSVGRPPSQPAGVSSAFSVTQAFLQDRNGLHDEEGTPPENRSALQDRNLSPQIALDHRDYVYGGHGSSSYCQHRHCCRNHSDHSRECLSGKVDLLDDSRPMPGSYFGPGPRLICDTDHVGKFHLSSIPEDDLPQSV